MGVLFNDARGLPFQELAQFAWEQVPAVSLAFLADASAGMDTNLRLVVAVALDAVVTLPTFKDSHE